MFFARIVAICGLPVVIIAFPFLVVWILYRENWKYPRIRILKVSFDKESKSLDVYASLERFSIKEAAKYVCTTLVRDCWPR